GGDVSIAWLLACADGPGARLPREGEGRVGFVPQAKMGIVERRQDEQLDLIEAFLRQFEGDTDGVGAISRRQLGDALGSLLNGDVAFESGLADIQRELQEGYITEFPGETDAGQ